MKKYNLTGLIIGMLILILGSSYRDFSLIELPGAIDPFLNGALPRHTPGAEGAWRLEDSFSEVSIPSPILIKQWPESEDLIVLSKTGSIWRISSNGSEQQEVLNITDRTFHLSDAGAVGMALHPNFGDSDFPQDQLLFVYYKTKPDAAVWDERGFNRLSKFRWDDTTSTFDADSEEILIQQYDRSPWHNGGSLFFGLDGFLYFAVGDEGASDFIDVSTQRLDGGFFNGVFRIDIDNDTTRSHPIRRQPLSNDSPPAGWGHTYSQGYSIPNDNPWLDQNGQRLEEYYAIGLRSPFAVQQDSLANEIWIVDAGSDKREELNILTKGDNLQWPFMEGFLSSPDINKPDNVIGTEKEPYFEYDRSLGTCMVGGVLYRSGLYPNLYGHYLFGDFTSKIIGTVYQDDLSETPKHQIIISDITQQGIDLPENPAVSGIFQTQSGKILVTIIGEDHSAPGKIVELVSQRIIEDPKLYLSDLGAFEDLNNMTPISGLIPYSVNVPLWSDGAAKYRWVAIPNDGEFDEAHEQIDFHSFNAWDFPIGTVFIKHFAVPDLSNANGMGQPIETRFFVIAEDRKPYGLTYVWNEEGTDAILLKGSIAKELEFDPHASTQQWTFPSRGQCISCHNQNTGSVLGFKTSQLNKTHDYTFGRYNQLDYFSEMNLFGKSIKSNNHLQLSSMNLESETLEKKIRSYLDANCSNCHRAGGIATLSMDLRYERTVNLGFLLNTDTESHASSLNGEVVVPGDHAISELWIRDASNGENQMPPIGRALVDQVYVDSLAKWIDGLNPDETIANDLLLYPNPAIDWFSMHIAPKWSSPPHRISIYSVDGRTMRSFSHENFTLTLDVSHYPKGIYFIAVESGEKRILRKVVLTGDH